MDDDAATAAEAIQKESVEIIQGILKDWEGREWQFPTQDLMLLGAIAARCLDFGYFTMMRQLGREGADQWLQMALGFVETDISRSAHAELKLKVIWGPSPKA